MEQIKEITAEELASWEKNSYQLIDIRETQAFAYGHLPDAVNMPEDMLREHWQELEPKRAVLYCQKGQLSAETAVWLGEKGVETFSLKGGYLSWLLEDFDREKEENREDTFYLDVEQSIRKKFRKDIWCRFTKAVKEYELVKAGDRIAVCISGGKDSMLMAKLFQELQKHNKVPFEVIFLVMNPGYSEANMEIIRKNAEKLHIPVTVFETDIFESVYHVEKSPCYLCARMRRGYLYSRAKELGCNKIALGHHYDDVIETILMGMIYGAQIQTMMPKLHSTHFEGMELIRPMYLVREDSIKAWSYPVRMQIYGYLYHLQQ